MNSPPNRSTDPDVATVLLVDDREEDLAITRIGLFKRPKLRCNLLSARDGRDAYQLLTCGCYAVDLMLLDINMPDVNGFELLEQVRGNDALRHIAVIMCSGSDHEPDRRRSLDLGAAGYLLKPPAFAPFRAIVERCPALSLRKEGASFFLTRGAA